MKLLLARRMLIYNTVADPAYSSGHYRCPPSDPDSRSPYGYCSDIWTHHPHFRRWTYCCHLDTTIKFVSSFGCIIQGLVCHASGQRAVSDHRYNGRLLPFEISGLHQSQSCGYGGRTVAGIKCVIITFFSSWGTHSCHGTGVRHRNRPCGPLIFCGYKTDDLHPR